MNNKLLLSSMLLAGLAVGCASHKASDSAAAGPSIEAKQVAVEQEASYVTEFSFKKGSAKLSEAAKTDLRNVIARAKQGGDIKDVKVITWGDAEYPSSSTKKLSSAEIDLVKKRNKSITDFVKSVSDGLDVDTHSMAERPGALTELFNTSDARIKKSLETAGIPNTDTSVKVPSKASKSIVMVIRE